MLQIQLEISKIKKRSKFLVDSVFDINSINKEINMISCGMLIVQAFQ